MTADRPLWAAELDGRFLVQAMLIPGRRVVVTVNEIKSGRTALRRVLPLVGHPRYGPDPDDVMAWQSLAEGAVESPTDAKQSADRPSPVTRRRNGGKSPSNGNATLVRLSEYRQKRDWNCHRRTVGVRQQPHLDGDAA